MFPIDLQINNYRVIMLLVSCKVKPGFRNDEWGGIFIPGLLLLWTNDFSWTDDGRLFPVFLHRLINYVHNTVVSLNENLKYVINVQILLMYNCLTSCVLCSQWSNNTNIMGTYVTDLLFLSRPDICHLIMNTRLLEPKFRKLTTIWSSF